MCVSSDLSYFIWQKMKETSGGVTQEGPLFQGGHTTRNCTALSIQNNSVLYSLTVKHWLRQLSAMRNFSSAQSGAQLWTNQQTTSTKQLAWLKASAGLRLQQTKVMHWVLGFLISLKEQINTKPHRSVENPYEIFKYLHESYLHFNVGSWTTKQIKPIQISLFILHSSTWDHSL